MTTHDPGVGGADPAAGHAAPPLPDADLGYVWTDEQTQRKRQRERRDLRRRDRRLRWYHVALAALAVVCIALLIILLTRGSPRGRPLAATSSATVTATPVIVATTTATATATATATTTVTATATPTVGPAPAPTLTTQPATQPATQAPTASTGPGLNYCSGQSNCVVIDWSSACTWAFPGQASGQITGTWDTIQCLGISGNPLGGFNDNTGHSLNDWCGVLSDQNNINLRQAKVSGPTTWECVAVT